MSFFVEIHILKSYLLTYTFKNKNDLPTLIFLVMQLETNNIFFWKCLFPPSIGGWGGGVVVELSVRYFHPQAQGWK